MKSRSDLTRSEIDAIISASEVCHVGMVDGDNGPYVLPMNFGYNQGRIFIHSGPVGKKLGLWEMDNRVCLAFSTDYKMRIQNESVACSYSMRYKSALVYGRLKPVEGFDDKVAALNVIMAHYTQNTEFAYSKPAVENVRVFEVEVDRMDGRIYGY